MRRFVFVAIVFVGSIFLAEVAARTMVTMVRGPMTFETDARLGFRYRPSLNVHRIRSGCDWRFRTDEHGHRVVPGNPAAGSAPTVVLLGDSFVFGDGVDDDQTCAAVLASHGLHVANLAVTGYGTQQQLLALQDYFAAGHSADWVISFTYTNDATDVTSSYRSMHHQPVAVLESGEARIPEFTPPWSDVLVCRSYLCAVGRAVFSNHDVRVSGDGPSIVAACLRRIDAEARQAGAETLFVAHDAVEPDRIRPILNAARQTELDLRDLSPLLQTRMAGGENLICPDGMHWSPTGGRLVADFVLERIRIDESSERPVEKAVAHSVDVK